MSLREEYDQYVLDFDEYGVSYIDWLTNYRSYSPCPQEDSRKVQSARKTYIRKVAYKPVEDISNVELWEETYRRDQFEVEAEIVRQEKGDIFRQERLAKQETKRTHLSLDRGQTKIIRVSPKTRLAAARYFADIDVCVDFVAAMRWPNGVVCPNCASDRVSYLSSRRIWKCMKKDCHKQFSVKTQSVFEDSPIPLDKWLTAVWLVVNCKNGVSSYEINRDLGVTQKSAWFMLHRIRLALSTVNMASCKLET
jgi:transposase-like protein